MVVCLSVAERTCGVSGWFASDFLPLLPPSHLNPFSPSSSANSATGVRITMHGGRGFMAGLPGLPAMGA